MNRIAEFIVKKRLAIITAGVAITLILGYFSTKLTINSNFMSYLPDDDRKVMLFERTDSLYATGNIIVIGISNTENTIITPEGISVIRQVTDSISEIEGVEKVTGLANVIDIRHRNDGVEIGRLMDEEIIPDSLPSLQSYILNKEMYRGRLLSEDGRSTAIIVFVGTAADKEKAAREVNDLLDEVRRSHPELTVYCDGLPMQQQSLTESTEKDLIRLVPLVCLLIALILALTLHSLRGIFLPLLSVAMGSIWSMGAMGLFHVQLSPISGSIPVVLFAVGSAYTIHVLNFFKLLENGENHKEIVVRGITIIGVPVMLAGLTTIVGFLSFIPGTYLSIIRDFGIFMALGTFFCLLLSLTFIPAVESYLPPLKHQEKKQKKHVLSDILQWLAGVSIHRNKMVLYCAGGLILLMGAGLFRLKSNIDVLYYFPEKHPLRQSAAFLNREFGGTLPIQIKVTADLTRPETLAAMQDFEDFLSGLPHVHNPQSVTELIKEMNQAMGEGKQIPDTQEKIQNLWFLLEGDPVMEQLCNTDKSEGMIHATMCNAPTGDYHAVSRKIDEYAAAHSSGTVQFETTGLPSIYSNFDYNLMQNLFWSLLLACVLVFICMTFLVKSLKSALVGFVPLMSAILFIFGLMGYLGIALNLATVLIAGVAVGIGVDYSIHFISGYRNALVSGKECNEAVIQTLQTSGKGILFNVTAVAFGFLVLVFADLVPLKEFGLIMFATMFVSGLAATLLLPSMILCFHINLNKTQKQ